MTASGSCHEDGQCHQGLVSAGHPEPLLAVFPGHGHQLLWLRDWSDELRAAAGFEKILRRLPRLVKFPMPFWAFVGGVENRMVKEGVGHGSYAALIWRVPANVLERPA